MIFSKTHHLILSADKTQTRRPVKYGECLHDFSLKRGESIWAVVTTSNGGDLNTDPHANLVRTKVCVGHSYAVQPGRGLPAVLYNPHEYSDGGAVWDRERGMYRDRMGNYWSEDYITNILRWRPLRVTITAIRQEDVRQISEADAIAEGFKDQFYFWITWTKMHDPKMYRHIEGYLNSTRDNPAGYMQKRPAEKYLAWVYEFKIAE